MSNEHVKYGSLQTFIINVAYSKETYWNNNPWNDYLVVSADDCNTSCVYIAVTKVLNSEDSVIKWIIREICRSVDKCEGPL